MFRVECCVMCRAVRCVLCVLCLLLCVLCGLCCVCCVWCEGAGCRKVKEVTGRRTLQYKQEICLQTGRVWIDFLLCEGLLKSKIYRKGVVGKKKGVRIVLVAI